MDVIKEQDDQNYSFLLELKFPNGDTFVDK